MFRSKLVIVAAAALSVSLAMSCGGKKVKPSETQIASAGGFETVTSPATELEEIKRQLEDRMIPCGLGIGESTDEMVARNMASDEARSAIATSIDVQVQRLSESYAQNVGGEAKRIWEEAVRQITNQHVQGTRVYKSIPQFNKETGRHKIYTLMVLDPKLFKDAIQQSMARDEEIELRVKKDDMLRKLDENIKLYDDKYRGR